MAAKPYVSIVTSILLSPINNGKRIKGFKRAQPPLPWYTAQQMEDIRREELRNANNQNEEEEDPVLRTLRQKDLKMKRAISQLFSEHDTDNTIENCGAKRVRTDQTENRFSLSNDSDEFVTPNETTDSPESEDTNVVSGRYRLEDDSDIDPSEYELIISESIKTKTISQELVRHQTSKPLEERETLATDSIDRRDREETKATDDATNTTALDSTVDSVSPPPSDASRGHKDRSLTEEELAEINRQRFRLQYESMCRVVGVSKEDGDSLLKEWEEQESTVKPPGILKNPTERFDTKPDPPQPDTPAGFAERVVSFLIPETKECTAAAVEPQPISTTVELTKPTLLIPPLPSAIMSTPILPSSIASQAVLPQDLSLITPEFIRSQHPAPPLVTHSILPVSADPQPANRSNFLSRLITTPSPVLALPTSSLIPAETIITTKPNPLAFLHNIKPQTPEPSSSIFKLQSATPTPAASFSLFPTFLNSSAPPVSSAAPLFQTPFAPLSTSSSLSASQSYKSTPIPATSIQLRPSKPFHNLEISYSNPTDTSKSLFHLPAPTQPSTVPSLSLPASSAAVPAPSPFKPMDSPFQPKSLHSSLLTQAPLLSSTPALSKPAVQVNPTSAPAPNAFSFISQTASNLPSAPVFTPNIPLSFNFGQPTDTNNSAIFLGPAAARSSTNHPSNYRASLRTPFKKKRK